LLEAYRREKRREGKAVMDGEIGFRRLLERFGGRDAASITTREVKEWRDSPLDGHTPATVNRHLTILRAILRVGMRDRRISADALPEIEAFEENNARVRWLSDEEESHLLAAARANQRPLLVVAIHTGLRKSELLRLRWSDVDFAGRAIHVRESKSGQGRYVPMVSDAQLPLSLGPWAAEQLSAFGDIVVPSLRWPLLGCWLARRRLKRAQARGALALTTRELTIVGLGVLHMIAAVKGLPTVEAGASAGCIMGRLGIEWELVEQIPLECVPFAVAVITAIRPELKVDSDIAAALTRAGAATK